MGGDADGEDVLEGDRLGRRVDGDRDGEVAHRSGRFEDARSSGVVCGEDPHAGLAIA